MEIIEDRLHPFIKGRDEGSPLQIYLKKGERDYTLLTVLSLHDNIPTCVLGDTKEDAEKLREIPLEESVVIKYKTKEGNEQKERVNAKTVLYLIGGDYMTGERGLIRMVDSVEDMFKEIEKD